MCYPDDDFITSEADIHLADLDVPGLERAVPFWMSVSQYEYWKHTHLTVDVVPGRGSGFSVEAPEGVRFLTRSRLLTDTELAHFQKPLCLYSDRFGLFRRHSLRWLASGRG
jgi:hypothetical protein